MIRISTLLSLASLPFFCLSTLAQTYTPKTIQFKGDTGYTDAELTTAAGFKKGQTLTVDQMNEHTKVLMDTGLFQDVSFTFNGADLVFKMVPATVLVPIEFENIPLADGPDLDARLRARFPLYRGKVPVDGGFVEDVRQEIEEELKAQGIPAKVIHAPYTDQKLRTITAETFTISSPDVSIGEVRLQGASAELSASAQTAASRTTGQAFSNASSVNQVETALGNFYGERGYLGAAIHASQSGAPVVDAAGVHVPFNVTVTEGSPYTLAGVTLAPGLLVTQELFNKQSGMQPGKLVSLLQVRESKEFVTHQYRNKGYMLASIALEPTFDRAANTVRFTVTAIPGPVFTMGALRVVNVPAELHDPLLAAWKIPAGGTFDESAARNLAASANLPPELKRILTIANIRSTFRLHEEIHTVDVELTLVRKPL